MCFSVVPPIASSRTLRRARREAPLALLGDHVVFPAQTRARLGDVLSCGGLRRRSGGGDDRHVRTHRDDDHLGAALGRADEPARVQRRARPSRRNRVRARQPRGLPRWRAPRPGDAPRPGGRARQPHVHRLHVRHPLKCLGVPPFPARLPRQAGGLPPRRLHALAHRERPRDGGDEREGGLHRDHGPVRRGGRVCVCPLRGDLYALGRGILRFKGQLRRAPELRASVRLRAGV